MTSAVGPGGRKYQLDGGWWRWTRRSAVKLAARAERMPLAEDVLVDFRCEHRRPWWKPRWLVGVWVPER